MPYHAGWSRWIDVDKNNYNRLLAINSIQLHLHFAIVCKCSIRSHRDTETERKFEFGNHFALRNMHTRKSKKKKPNRNFGWELITRRSGNKLSQLLEQPEKSSTILWGRFFLCWYCRWIWREEAIELGQ